MVPKAIITVIAMIAGIVATTAPAAAQHCEVRCFDHCWMTPRGRCCARQCVRQCYAPRYVAPPQPRYESGYAYTPYQHTWPQFPPEIAVLALGIVGVAIVGAILLAASSSSTQSVIAATDAIRADTDAMHGVTADTRSATADLESAMQTAARKSYERGRTAADEDWRCMLEDRHGR